MLDKRWNGIRRTAVVNPKVVAFDMVFVVGKEAGHEEGRAGIIWGLTGKSSEPSEVSKQRIDFHHRIIL